MTLQTNRLSDRFVRTAKTGFYNDGHGLNLRVLPSGSRQWVQRLAIRGKACSIGLGGYPLVSLVEARQKALANRQIARAGRDPRIESNGTPTFSEAAAKLIDLHRPGWKSLKHAEQWRSTLQGYVYPRLGETPVRQITSADVLEVLKPIWFDKAETARRVRQRMRAVFNWAIAQGYRSDNPAGETLSLVLPRQNNVKQHMRALPYSEVADAIEAVRESGAYKSVKLAFEFLVLTAARSGEVRLATWVEFDGDVWTIPGERMKARRPHRVPLSNRAVEILHEARSLADPSGLVFPSPRGRTLSDSTLSKLLREIGLAAVPHGFRSSFRDWAAECTNAPHAVMESALAHVVRDKVEAAYARTDLFEKRRKLMEQWTRYLGEPRGDVIPLVRPDSRD